jgi:hypothetical protein
MGLQSAGATTGLGVTFGTVLLVTTPIAVGAALILAVAGSAILETLRRANWTRE